MCRVMIEEDIVAKMRKKTVQIRAKFEDFSSALLLVLTLEIPQIDVLRMKSLRVYDHKMLENDFEVKD